MQGSQGSTTHHLTNTGGGGGGVQQVVQQSLQPASAVLGAAATIEKQSMAARAMATRFDPDMVGTSKVVLE